MIKMKNNTKVNKGQFKKDRLYDCYTDREECRGHAMLFHNITDIARAAKRGAETKGKRAHIKIDGYGSWGLSALGRKITSWDQMVEMTAKTWKDGVKRVNEMLDEIRNSHIEPPKSRKRRFRFEELEGEVDVDRGIKGEPELYRNPHRNFVNSPTNVCVLANLDAWAGDSAERVFWRGAAVIAAIDLLEEAGYSCECWMWCRGSGVYEYPNSNQFTACKMKECGQDLNKDTLINGLSSWFLRLGVFGSFDDCIAEACRSIGSARYEIGPWEKYLDIQENIHKVYMPAVFDKNAAIEAAKEVLEKVTNPPEEE